jgi:hypothetical protein
MTQIDIGAVGSHVKLSHRIAFRWPLAMAKGDGHQAWEHNLMENYADEMEAIWRIAFYTAYVLSSVLLLPQL